MKKLNLLPFWLGPIIIAISGIPAVMGFSILGLLILGLMIASKNVPNLRIVILLVTMALCIPILYVSFNQILIITGYSGNKTKHLMSLIGNIAALLAAILTILTCLNLIRTKPENN